MSENCLPPRAESERRGPDSPGKSFAEIAAMLMKVPVPDEAGLYQQPSYTRAEPAAAPGIGDTTTVASRATHPTDATVERIDAPPMTPASDIDPPPSETPRLQDGIVPPPRVRTGRKAMVLSIVGLLCILIISAVAVDFDPARLKLLGEPGMQVDIGSEAVAPSLHLASLATSSPRPARLVVESQKGFANEPLPLRISLSGAGGGEALMLIGLAEGTRLSVGTPLGSSGWLVPAQDIDKAFAYSPRDFVGVMDARIDLRSASGQLVDSQVVRLEWIEKKIERAAPQPDPPVAPSVIQPRRDPAELAVLLGRAKDFLKTGDLVAARILLRRAADGGNAAAALQLGMTFDPVVLEQQGVVGFAPDPAQAREWYDKAMKLGSTEASHRLERLSPMSK